MTDKYLNNHPLAEHLKMNQAWATPIGEVAINLPQDIRDFLIKRVAFSGYGTTMGTSTKTQTEEFEVNHYNLFDLSETEPLMAEFETISSELIRFYIANAYEIPDAEKLRIDARCFGNMQTKNHRTYPHYHHSFDGVMILYLTCGGEYELVGGDKYSEKELVQIPPESKVTKVESDNDKLLADYGAFQLKQQDLPCEGSGTMILTDPRPAINFPYGEKCMHFNPKNGMAVFHPAYVWHESNAFTGEGVRCAVVINYRILTNTTNNLVKRIVNI